MDNNNNINNVPQSAVPAATTAPLQPISISLAKKKKKTPTQKLRLAPNEEEYSTIAEHAEVLSKRRNEEGHVLVIPCSQRRDEGKPLLAQRSQKQQDLPIAKPETEGKPTGDSTIEEEDEATRQLIESATNREFNEGKKRSSLTIVAPQQNTLNVTSSDAQLGTNDDELFRRDLSSRADDVDPTSSTYASISIRDFGGALLRGMGWKGEESGDTKKKGEEVNKARPHRLGLGATPLLPPPTGKHGRARRPEELKKEEERQRLEEEREKKALEMQRLDKQFTLQKGSIVYVDGERAKVVQTAGVPGLNRILVRMETGKEESINKGSATLCSWEDLEKNPFKDMIRAENDAGKRDGESYKSNENRKENSSIDGNSDDDKERKGRRKESSRNEECSEDSRYDRQRKKSSRDKQYSSEDDSRCNKRKREPRREKHYSSDDSSCYKRKNSKRKKRDKSEGRYSRGRKDRNRDDDKKRNRQEKRSNQQDHMNWLLPNIRVRLVSKRFPRQHLQKGIVQDVISSQNSNPKAVILMDNQEVLDNIPERYLETALPKTGGNVIVLEGSHRLQKGRLLERSSGKGSGVIQLFEDLQVVEVSLDCVAEWCGPLDEDME